MRTTLTVDEDLAIALRKRARDLGISWKELVNTALREGLEHLDVPRPESRPYSTPVTDPGPPALKGVHSVPEMLAFAEGEGWR